MARYDTAIGWSASTLMQSNPAEVASFISLAGQADGTAWAVWTEQTVDAAGIAPAQVAVFAAEFRPGTGWGAPEKVTADIPIVFGPQINVVVTAKIATDGAGNPTVLWSDNNSIYATARVGGTWSAPAAVAPTIYTQLANGLEIFAIAMDSGGNAIATWQSNAAPNGVSTVFTSRLTAGAGWSPPIDMSVLANQNSADPVLVMDAAGNALLLWSEFDGSAALGIWSSRFVPASGWQLPAMISAPTGVLSDNKKPAI